MQFLIRSAPAFIVVALLGNCGVTFAQSSPPSVAELKTSITNARNPMRASSRDLTIEVRSPGGSVVTMHGKQFRKAIDGRRSVLTLLTAPASQAGFAYLVSETSAKKHTHWMYAPPVHRVRRMVYESDHDNVLNTDLSAGDIGFLSFEPDAQVAAKPAETPDGVDAWKLEEKPDEPTGYSRIVTWIALDTFLPLRREYYDEGGRPWKVDKLNDVEEVQGLPTVMKMTASDLQSEGETVVTFRNVRYDVALDDAYFSPASLPAAVEKIVPRAVP
ncbi:MAG: outer membrane lipoprotein-sorting protein [Candidatus Binatia bacterium]